MSAVTALLGHAASSVSVSLMIFKILFIGALLAALAFGADTSWAQHVGYAVGGCGGVMTGYNGRQYRCGADRLPVCNRNGQRCVCLALRKCGAKEDEPY
jgi:hypothetical protein